jgi:hypothetical protein
MAAPQASMADRRFGGQGRGVVENREPTSDWVEEGTGQAEARPLMLTAERLQESPTVGERQVLIVRWGLGASCYCQWAFGPSSKASPCPSPASGEGQQPPEAEEDALSHFCILPLSALNTERNTTRTTTPNPKKTLVSWLKRKYELGQSLGQIHSQSQEDQANVCMYFHTRSKLLHQRQSLIPTILCTSSSAWGCFVLASASELV